MFSMYELDEGLEFSKSFKTHDNDTAYNKLLRYKITQNSVNNCELKCLDEFSLFTQECHEKFFSQRSNAPLNEEESIKDNLNFKYGIEALIQTGSCWALSNYIYELICHIQIQGAKLLENLAEPWFSLIKLGIKKVEGRLCKNRFRELKVGDLIIWENNDFVERVVKTKVSALRTYKTFLEYLEKEKHNSPLPGMESIEEQCAVYYKYYTLADEEKYGVVAIELEIL